jgi:hypothetical protein
MLAVENKELVEIATEIKNRLKKELSNYEHTWWNQITAKKNMKIK